MKKPIRILHVLQRMEAGGTQALLMNLYRNINREKVQFDFLVEYPNEQFYDNEILELGGKIYYTNFRKDKNIFLFIKTFKSLVVENNYKIVHVHTYSIGYFILKAAKKLNVPVRIAHSHSNSMTNDYRKYLKYILQRLYPIYATDLMACSKDAGDYLFKGRNYQILKNAIDSKKFAFDNNNRSKIRKELHIENNFVIGHVGRFKPEKNHEFLIDLFVEIKRTNKNAKLLLVGNGDPNDNLINKIEKCAINDDVIILKNRTDVNELYHAMDVFVFPSLYEGLGIVAIEAQAAGTPCITSNNLPLESIVTPLCCQLDLNCGKDIWIKKIYELAASSNAHKNMSDYIRNANYDIEESSKFMENYYINKNK